MQNLNLYQVETARRSGPQRDQMLLGVALLLVAFIVYGGWLGWSLRQAGERQALAEAQAQQDEDALASQRATFIEPTLDPGLPVRLADRESRNRELQRLVDYLKQLESQQRQGFAAPLAALAEQHPATGLWLDAIALRNGGSELRLQGITQNQDLLPEYLKRLGGSPVFKGREFARFDIKRGEDDLLHFDLSSRADDDKEAKP